MMRCCTRLIFAFVISLLYTRSSSGAPLPTVGEIQARFANAIGGAAAITRPRSMTIRGANVLYLARGRQLRVAFVVYAADFKRLEIDTVPGKGQFLSGYDESTAWAMAPGSKPQIFSGADALSIRRDADLYYWAHIGTYFRSMKVVGIEPFAGHRCYHVRGTTLWGNENNQYFDVENGLLVGYRWHQWIGHAPEKAESRQIFDNYRNFNGLSIPTRETDIRDGRTIGIGRYLSVVFNNVDSRIFTPPAAVRGLERR